MASKCFIRKFSNLGREIRWLGKGFIHKLSCTQNLSRNRNVLFYGPCCISYPQTAEVLFAIIFYKNKDKCDDH